MTIKEAQQIEAAVHKHCMACSGNDRKAVANCPMKTCALFPYRMPQAAISQQEGPEQVSLLDGIDV